MTQSLSCNLKAQQKVILLHQRLAYSCCRGYPVKLTDDTSYQTISQQWDHEQQQIDKNIPVPSCEVCWQDERNNITSYRQLIGQDPKQLNIQLGFSNACNHMCVYCSPKYSSTWQKSMLVHGDFTKVSRSTNINLRPPSDAPIDVDAWVMEIQQEINKQPDYSVNLTLLGGEPLMQKDSLKQILELVSSKIKLITIITNLNPPDNKFLQWLLLRFPKDQLYFEISLDATPEFNHIPRSGFDQERFKENLELLKSENINFEFLAVCSVLNFFDLPRYQRWIERNGFFLKQFKLNNPICLDPIWIPDQFVQPILNQLLILPEFFQQFKEPQPMVDLKLFEQYNYLSQYFERTNINVNTTNEEFNQYWAWLEEKFK